jgi:phosphoglucosamine mutase (EC 5.4.2.10)
LARKWFGTDGVRGQVGDSIIHPEWVLRLGWAAGHVLTADAPGRPQVVIGKDTRLSGYMLESALESGLAAAGVDVLLVGPLPTPAIAYLTRTLRADAGIVISASHNPYQDNGIKFFSGDGYKLPDAQEEAIEAWMDRPMTLPASERLGKARRVDDAVGRYVEFCKTTFPADLNLRGMHLVLDCAHGANYKVAPMIFGELGATLDLLGQNPTASISTIRWAPPIPERCAPQCSAPAPIWALPLMVTVIVCSWWTIKVNYSTVMKFSGCWHGICVSGELSGVVGTVMTNLALEQALAGCGVPMLRAPVDRYVLEAMRRHGYPLGGESSGHIITPANTTGDGILAALRILAILRRTGEALAALREGYRPFPQVLKSVRIAGAQSLLDQPLARQLIADAEDRLGCAGRLLVRPSGTEPLLRVMVEAASADMAADVAVTLTAELAKLAFASAVQGPPN